MKKRKEVTVRNNPGIYKELMFVENKWKETGRFRAIRRVALDGKSKKEQGVFHNIEDAKSFRSGLIEKSSTGKDVHKNEVKTSNEITFDALVKEWKSFHYLQIEHSSQQFYDTRIPHFELLNNLNVESITPTVMDRLVKFWVKEAPKNKQRCSFEKELMVLKVILGFYQKRFNPLFKIPILNEHFKASDILRRAERPVESLSQKELGEFLEVLKSGREPQYYYLALTQFCFGLRIGEACGLTWCNLDLESREAIIEQTIVWDHKTWEPSFKNRPKNGKVRVLSIPEFLIQELKELKRNRAVGVDLVFHRHGKPLVRKNIGKVYNLALIKLGITHVR